MRSAGLEPATPWFEARYSVQLSYGRGARRRNGRFDARDRMGILRRGGRIASVEAQGGVASSNGTESRFAAKGSGVPIAAAAKQHLIMAKNITNGEEVEELPPIEEVLPDAPPDAPEVVGAPAVKRPLGVKEPIEFKWKVLGAVPGAILTLFKSVERADADAQFERLQREGYYKDLQIVEATFKVEQPPQPKSAKKAPAKVEVSPPSPVKGKTNAPPVPSSVKKGVKAPPPPPPSKKPVTAKPAVKALAKAEVKSAPKSAPKAAVKPVAKKKPAPPTKKTAKAK